MVPKNDVRRHISLLLARKRRCLIAIIKLAAVCVLLVCLLKLRLIWYLWRDYTCVLTYIDKSHQPSVTDWSLCSTDTYEVFEPKHDCDPRTANVTWGRVFWVVMAGRRRRLALQERFWIDLHRRGLITEVHLWDCTLKTPDPEERRQDKEWIKAKANEHAFVKYINAFAETQTEWSFYGWHSIYKYYGVNSNHDDIIVKVDDDIVFVNTTYFKCYVKYVHERTDVFTLSANVVNNGVIAFLQQKLGSIPLSWGYLDYPRARRGGYGTLWKSPDLAVRLHKYFIDHKRDFVKEEILRYHERLSINFIAYSGARIATEGCVVTVVHGVRSLCVHCCCLGMILVLFLKIGKICLFSLQGFEERKPNKQ